MHIVKQACYVVSTCIIPPTHIQKQKMAKFEKCMSGKKYKTAVGKCRDTINFTCGL